jgi:transcriptional antiterminator NusG
VIASGLLDDDGGFAKGQKVRLDDGPFLDFVGIVDEVSLDDRKVKVIVSFFSRPIPVELELHQVKRA